MTDNSSPTPEFNLTAGLRAWAHKHEISPADLAAELGYDKVYAWTLLRGKGEVKEQALGKFVLAFGIEATKELLDLAAELVDFEFLPGPDDADAVPVATVR